MENQYFLSNTQKVSKPNYNAGSQSVSHEDAKLFLNSTLNMSNYNSNALDSRNQTSNNKSSRNGTQQTVIHHQTVNAAKGMPVNALQA